MRRFFTQTIPVVGERMSLNGDEARHMITVLRMVRGDELLLVSGDGTEYSAVIDECGRDSVILSVLSEKEGTAEPKTHVTLFQCLPKAGKVETIIQKCVELGIHDVQLVLSSRCVVKPDNRDNKLIRYNRISREAAKQCGRAIAPEIMGAVKLSECDFSKFELVLVAYENEQELGLKGLLRRIEKKVESVALVIGPEGGFEHGEVDFILNSSRNAHSVSLGRRILRTETAGMAMLAMLMYEMED